ncbi:hypothetical protein [Streptomyces phaeoluteigriseus]|nr:hypothetical protein [Streptomyces phaeoluteigriseus]
MDGDFGDLWAEPERVGGHPTLHGLPDLQVGARETWSPSRPDQVTSPD